MWVGRFVSILVTKRYCLIFVACLVVIAILLISCGNFRTTIPSGASGKERLYGPVVEINLPWYHDPPSELQDIRDEHGASIFISAFRTTLPDPIYQEEDNVAVAAGYLSGNVVHPGQVFSLNKAIGQRTKARGFGPGPVYVNGNIGTTIGGGICKVATTMFNVAVQADLQIVERHPHSMLVPYVPPGRDATILWAHKDLRFRNNKDTPIVIWSGVYGQTLFIALYGQYYPPLVEWHYEELGRNKTWVIKRQNPNLPTGEVRTMEGYDGVSGRTWIQIYYPDQTMQKRDFGVDYYRPMPGLIEYGP